MPIQLSTTETYSSQLFANGLLFETPLGAKADPPDNQGGGTAAAPPPEPEEEEEETSETENQ
jgi:hypothetical protein